MGNSRHGDRLDAEGEGRGDGKAEPQQSELRTCLPFSENNVSRTHRTEFQLELPVKYAVYMVVTRCCPTPPPPSDWTQPASFVYRLLLCVVYIYTRTCVE